jgi:rare lipoprotein A
LALAVVAALGGCSALRGSHDKVANDGLPAEVPTGLDHLPDPVPKAEALDPHANKPYTVLGHTYTPDTSDEPFEQRGFASWYGRAYQGNRTASGEPYDMFSLTAAHPTLPIPSYARVTSTRDGRSVVVRINDRGPFVEDRVIDLSYAAATRLGIAQSGTGEVIVHRITATEIAQGEPSPPPESTAAPEPTVSHTGATAVKDAAEAAAGTAEAAGAVAPVAAAAAVEGASDAAVAAKLLAEPASAAGAHKVTEESGAPEGVDGKAPAPATSVLAKADTAESAADPKAKAEASTEKPADQANPAEKSASAPAISEVPPKAWAVQLGVFARPENAQGLAEKISKALADPQADSLPDSFRQVRLIKTGALARVLVGDVASAKAAQKMANRLAKILSVPTAVYHAATP